jgi:hypothetical protein
MTTLSIPKLTDDSAYRQAWQRRGALQAEAALARLGRPRANALWRRSGAQVVAELRALGHDPEVRAALRQSLREGVPWCWQEVQAVEAVLDEVAEEFNGEDPLLPPVREVLDKTRRDLVDLHLLLDFVDAEGELPEPDDERVEFLRQRWPREDR